jgi:5'-nucleotidase / UDP-sugar diphosphatase
VRKLLNLSIVVLATAQASCLPVLEGQDEKLWGQQVHLTFLGTTDIHSRLLPYDFAPLRTDVDLGLIPEAGPFGGVTRLASILKRERAKSDRVLHLDAGDSFQGAPIFNVNFGEVEYKFLSLVGLDAAVIGNHEFDAGPANFTKQARDNATFPVLAANYLWNDYRNDASSNRTGLYTQPYTIKNMRGVRVGIIGLANISSLNSIVEGGNSLQVTPLEQNEAVRGYVEMLRPVTDLIVIVSHAGLTEDQELIRGYEAYYEYGRISSFLNRERETWKVLDWYGPIGEATSVVKVKIPGVTGIDVIIGGHLHVVLNPPQVLTDPAGRKVILSHNGAFSKYLGRLDVVVQMPDGPGTSDGAEVLTHTYRTFPVDSLWCSEPLHDYYKSKFWAAGEFITDPAVVKGIEDCKAAEDKETTQLLQKYIIGLDLNLNLTSIFGYAPRDIARRNNSTGGDSPLGNLAADSMRKRKRVEAEVAVTNSLGIRDNLYAGPLTQESMFNVFPFENTINIMYLSGGEMQELFDFISDRSAGRGCISQSQVSGARFVMDCAQVQLNELRTSCDPVNNGTDCPGQDRGERAPWQCIEDVAGSRCWAHPSYGISINGKPLDPNGTYRIAVNDYIAKGGSGFLVLKRNTTRVETGIPLRDSLVGYLAQFCNCDDYLGSSRDADGRLLGKNGQYCGSLLNGVWEIDTQVVAYCNQAKAFSDSVKTKMPSGAGECTCGDMLRGRTVTCGIPLTGQATVDEQARKALQALGQQQCVPQMPAGPNLGKCTCKDALAGAAVCGSVTSQILAFCENPTAMSIAVGVEDGRIARRVK